MRKIIDLFFDRDEDRLSKAKTRELERELEDVFPLEAQEESEETESLLLHERLLASI